MQPDEQSKKTMYIPKVIIGCVFLSGCVNTIDTTDLEVVPSNETLMALEADNIQNIQEKKQPEWF